MRRLTAALQEENPPTVVLTNWLELAKSAGRPSRSNNLSLARRKRPSANRVIVDLIETGLEAREREKRAFFELAERLTHASDAAEQNRLKQELARMTFGE
ncbi:MAG TPA: hypothetical protein VNA04_05665 [Thermoanaerobaculia bacterium]|nr:hypothetical protein [Thermoanaerobaculia bacterium]